MFGAVFADFAPGLGPCVTVFLLEGLSLSRDFSLGLLDSRLSGLRWWAVESESVWRLAAAGDEESFLLSDSFLIRDTLASSLILGAVETYVLVSSIGFPSSSASSI